MKSFTLTVLFSLLFSTFTYSQSMDWSVDFEQILDNREYTSDNIYDNDRTILGSKINAFTGFSYNKKHNIYIGVNYFHELGRDLSSEYLFLNLFYKHTSEYLEVYFGSFNRKFQLKYPYLFLDETLAYFKPNINGGLLKIHGKYGYQNIWCDWVSRQEKNVREQFLAGISGEYKRGIFYAENYLYMFHDALPKDNKDDLHIRDNGVAGIYFGIDLSKNTPLDILKFDIGGIIQYDRDRGKGPKFIFSKGLMPRIHLEMYKFGIKSSYYFGAKLDLPYGEPLYGSGNYSRTDFYYQIYDNDIISSKASVNVHVVDGLVNFSQQLFLYIKFDKLENIKTIINKL